MLTLDFTTPPYEAIAYMQSKHPKVIQDSTKLKYEAYNKVFTIKGIAHIDLLSDIQTSISKALAKGQSFNTWKKELEPLLNQKGWGTLNNKRLKKIYETNMLQSYAEGKKKRYMSMQASPNYPTINELTSNVSKDIAQYDDGMYLRFITMFDNRVRQSHRPLHGVILPRLHPFWEAHTPPLDFGCRCRVMALSANMIKKKGLRVTQSLPQAINTNKSLANTDLRDIIDIKLKRHKTNPNATQRLQSILQELDERNERFKRISELWDTHDIERVENIAKTPKMLQDIFNTKAEYIAIRASVIQDHKERHPEIDSFDYFLIGDMLENIDSIYQDEKSNVKYILASKLGRWYRLSLKSLNDKEEIWVESLVSIGDKDTLLKKLKNKKVIYQKEKA